MMNFLVLVAPALLGPTAAVFQSGDSRVEEHHLSLEESLLSVLARATAAQRRSQGEIEELKSACVENFHLVDADRDKRLSLLEFQRLLKIMGEKHGF